MKSDSPNFQNYTDEDLHILIRAGINLPLDIIMPYMEESIRRTDIFIEKLREKIKLQSEEEFPTS